MGIFNRKSTELADNRSLAREIGVSGDVVFTGYQDEELRTDRISIKEYRKMIDTDPTVEALFSIIALPIIATNYRIVADENDTDEAQAQFVRRNLLEPPHKGGMETPFSLFLDQSLQAVYEGFQLFEKVYKIENGKYVLRKLAHRDSTTITLKRDRHGGYAGAVQRASFGMDAVDVQLPAYKTFLFTYKKSRSYLYGRSAFKSSYPKYDKKKRLEYLDSIALQADAIKPKLLKRIEKLGLSKEIKQAASKALAALARLGETKPVASLPYGYDVEVLNTEGRDPATSIERQNSEMARAFFAQIILNGTQGKDSNVGSYALSTNQKDMLSIGIKAIMRLLEEHINQYIIADLIDLNFANRHYPEFKFDDPTEDTMRAISEAFTALIAKDRISDEMAQGIEESTASRLGIDLERLKKERADAKENGGAAGDGGKFRNQALSDSLHESLGIDKDKLGCIMLDVERLDVLKHVDDAKADLTATDMDYSNVPGEDVPHVTLLFGLMKSAHEYRPQIEDLLKDIDE